MRRRNGRGAGDVIPRNVSGLFQRLQLLFDRKLAFLEIRDLERVNARVGLQIGDLAIQLLMVLTQLLDTTFYGHSSLLLVLGRSCTGFGPPGRGLLRFFTQK